MRQSQTRMATRSPSKNRNAVFRKSRTALRPRVSFAEERFGSEWRGATAVAECSELLLESVTLMLVFQVIRADNPLAGLADRIRAKVQSIDKIGRGQIDYACVKGAIIVCNSISCRDRHGKQM